MLSRLRKRWPDTGQTRSSDGQSDISSYSSSRSLRPLDDYELDSELAGLPSIKENRREKTNVVRDTRLAQRSNDRGDIDLPIVGGARGRERLGRSVIGRYHPSEADRARSASSGSVSSAGRTAIPGSHISTIHSEGVGYKQISPTKVNNTLKPLAPVPTIDFSTSTAHTSSYLPLLQNQQREQKWSQGQKEEGLFAVAFVGDKLSSKPEVNGRAPYTVSTIESDRQSAQIWSSTGINLEVIAQSTEYTRESSTLTESLQHTYPYDVQPLGLYTVPTVYSASETSDSLSQQNKGYIADLAGELFSAVNTAELDIEALSRISEMLPGLLRAFALQLGHQAAGQMHRDVSFFVHKYRRHVQDSFDALSPFENATSARMDEVQPGEFAIDRFLREPDSAQEPVEENKAYDEDEPVILLALNDESQKNYEDESETTSTVSENEDVTRTDVGLYRDFIKTTPAYRWLIASLQRESILTRGTPDIMETIKQSILNALPSGHKISKQAPPQAYKVTFEVAWEPLSFLKDQQYVETPEKAIQQAITFTGTANDSQAMTAREYLEQTWPATGAYIMQLVSDILSNDMEPDVTLSRLDGIELRAQISGSKFIVTATGTGDSVAEIGQQLAWLGAALRLSPFEVGAASCSPFIESTSLKPSTSLAVVVGQLPLIELYCKIDFKIEGLATDREGAAGQCWHDMFFKPLIVSGYPILTRSKHGLGTEMSLNMIAEFTGSYKAVEFNNMVYIKGLSAMVVAKEVIDDLIIWHYLYNSKGEHISYLDNKQQTTEVINLQQLETARHVVGWTENCEYHAGSAQAEYNIHGSGLPPPHAGAFLDRVTLSGGKFISGGVSIAVGVKNVPQHLVRKGYIPRLRWIDTKFVVLWDEEGKRGWLVNGTSALLHLVRASLQSYGKGPFSSKLRFKENQLHNSAKHTPNSAIEVLIDDHNLELEIWPGNMEISEEEEVKIKTGEKDIEVSKALKRKRGFTLFEDLVEEKYILLEQIMEYQRLRAGQNGYNLKTRTRKHLEGWDFRELVDDCDPRSRVATLSALGYGWVDFIRSIDAVTLFGCGFADIIQPLVSQKICPRWTKLPEGGYHLAASIHDLETITNNFGRKGANAIEPVHGLVWHSPGNTFLSCRCQHMYEKYQKYPECHYEPVQVLYPKWSRLFSRPRKPIGLLSTGAVVFGHNASWRYRWREGGGSKDSQEEELDRIIPETSRQVAEPATYQKELPDLERSYASLSTTDHSSRSHDYTDEDQLHSLRSDHTTLTSLTSPNESTVMHADGGSSTNKTSHAGRDPWLDKRVDRNPTAQNIPRSFDVSKQREMIGEGKIADHRQDSDRQVQSEMGRTGSHRARPTQYTGSSRPADFQSTHPLKRVLRREIRRI